MIDRHMIDLQGLNYTERMVLADILINDMQEISADPLPSEQKKLLLARLEEAKSNPDIYQSWHAVRRDILAKLT